MRATAGAGTDTFADATRVWADAESKDSSGNAESERITENSSGDGKRNGTICDSPRLLYAHKSELGRRGANTSADATILAPASTCVGVVETVSVATVARATVFVSRVTSPDAIGAGSDFFEIFDATFFACDTGAGVFLTGATIGSPNAARAEIPPLAKLTTGKRTSANAGNAINSDNTETAICRIFLSFLNPS